LASGAERVASLVVQIFEGQLRFGVHAGQQNTDFPSYLAMRVVAVLGTDFADFGTCRTPWNLPAALSG
jgi:hypothetical protein